MRIKNLLLVVLLFGLSVGTTIAQANHAAALDAIKRGNAKHAKAKYESAIEEYSRVPQSAGEIYAQALYNIGVCYYELWRTEDAIVFYQRAVEARQGHYPKALYAMGVALEDSGQPSQAKEAYKQAIVESGGTEATAAVAHYRLGLFLAREGDYEAAATLFREAIARADHKFPAGHNNLGVMLALAGRLNEAEREFKAALRQSDVAFDEAAHNLKLCRSLLSAPTKGQLALLKISTAPDTLIK